MLFLTLSSKALARKRSPASIRKPVWQLVAPVDEGFGVLVGSDMPDALAFGRFNLSGAPGEVEPENCHQKKKKNSYNLPQQMVINVPN